MALLCAVGDADADAAAAGVRHMTVAAVVVDRGAVGMDAQMAVLVVRLL